MTKIEQLLRQAQGDQIVWEALLEEIILCHGRDPQWIRGEEGSRILSETLSLAPGEISTEMDAKLDELGLLPDVKFVDGDGNPVFTLGQLAETAGIPLGRLRQDIRALSATRPLHLAAEVHRLN